MWFFLSLLLLCFDTVCHCVHRVSCELKILLPQPSACLTFVCGGFVFVFDRPHLALANLRMTVTKDDLEILQFLSSCLYHLSGGITSVCHYI